METINKDKKSRTDENAGKARLADKYKHIKGWGMDADPDNEPTYPMKKYTGDDHKRSDYEKPVQQPIDVEILKSNERPEVSAVFGTVSPPSGLSGAIRRIAFRYSEDSMKHWIPLVLADRINVIEGIIDDFRHGYFPNIIAEKGMAADWKYNRPAVVKKIAVGVAVIAAITLLVMNKKNPAKKMKYSM